MSSAGLDLQPGRLWSLWGMLLNYFPIYEITLDLQKLRVPAGLFKTSGISRREITEMESRDFRTLLEKIQRECPPLGLMQPSEIAESINSRPTPETYLELYNELTHLSESLSRELKKELIFRIPPDGKLYYEQVDLFGAKVSEAFPSCGGTLRHVNHDKGRERNAAEIPCPQSILAVEQNPRSVKMIGCPVSIQSFATISSA